MQQARTRIAATTPPITAPMLPPSAFDIASSPSLRPGADGATPRPWGGGAVAGDCTGEGVGGGGGDSDGGEGSGGRGEGGGSNDGGDGCGDGGGVKGGGGDGASKGTDTATKTASTA